MNIIKISFAILLSFCLMTATAQNSDNVIKVRGEATVSAVPEVLKFYIPLEAKAKTYEETSQVLTSTFNDLQSALIKVGVDKKTIISDNLSIRENYNYIAGQRILEGYVGTIALQIEMEHTPKNLNKVMHTLNNERYNFGYRASFSFSEAQKDSLREEAIKVAVKDAQNKAALLAEALQVELGEIKEVNFEFGSSGNDMLMRRDMMFAEAKSASGGGDIELNPQELEVQKSVGVIWKIAHKP